MLDFGWETGKVLLILDFGWKIIIYIKQGWKRFQGQTTEWDNVFTPPIIDTPRIYTCNVN